MTTINNKYEQIASKLGNIWIIILTLIINIAFLIAILQGKTGYIIFTIPFVLVFIASLLARFKIKNRYSIEFGYNLVRTVLSKKVQGSKEKVIIGDFIEYKNKLIIAYSFSFLDMQSLPVSPTDLQASQTDINSLYQSFIHRLPTFLECQILVKKRQSQAPNQLKRLGLEIGSYTKSNTVTYYLVLKTDKKSVEKAQNAIKEIFVREDLTLLTPFETLEILN